MLANTIHQPTVGPMRFLDLHICTTKIRKQLKSGDNNFFYFLNENQ